MAYLEYTTNTVEDTTNTVNQTPIEMGGVGGLINSIFTMLFSSEYTLHRGMIICPIGVLIGGTVGFIAAVGDVSKPTGLHMAISAVTTTFGSVVGLVVSAFVARHPGFCILVATPAFLSCLCCYIKSKRKSN